MHVRSIYIVLSINQMSLRISQMSNDTFIMKMANFARIIVLFQIRMSVQAHHARTTVFVLTRSISTHARVWMGLPGFSVKTVSKLSKGMPSLTRRIYVELRAL